MIILGRWTMNLRRARFAVGFGILTLATCGEPADPTHIGMPSFAAGGVGRPSVLVNPNADDKGTAKTIQEGIEHRWATDAPCREARHPDVGGIGRLAAC